MVLWREARLFYPPFIEPVSIECNTQAKSQVIFFQGIGSDGCKMLPLDADVKHRPVIVHIDNGQFHSGADKVCPWSLPTVLVDIRGGIGNTGAVCYMVPHFQTLRVGDVFCAQRYLVPVADIAMKLQCSQGKVKSSLFRTRQKLKEALQEEGLCWTH